MNLLPFEPKQFIFGHMHTINVQKQRIVQSPTCVSLLGSRDRLPWPLKLLLSLISDT